MEPLSGHKKIVPTPHGAYLRHLAMHMGGREGSTADTRAVQAVGCSGGQHRARKSPMATNGFQAPQALQDGTRHQTGVLTHRLLRTVLENTASPAPCCLMSISPTPPLGPAVRVKPHGTEHLLQVMKSTAPQHSLQGSTQRYPGGDARLPAAPLPEHSDEGLADSGDNV